MKATGVNLLAQIAEQRRETIARHERDEPRSELRQRAQQAAAPRDFVGALSAKIAANETAVIAEIKFTSPSAGQLRPGSAEEVKRIARAYAEAGAACLSVLTEPSHFDGSFAHLSAARSACELPILCKDFVVSPWQLYKARACGADAALLIVAMLPGDELLTLAQQAREAGLGILVETHTADELQWMLGQPLLSEAVIGINNRDLKTLQTSLCVTEQLAAQVPKERLCVSESGIDGPDDLATLAQCNVHAVLIGESLMRAKDPGRQLTKLLSAQL